MANRRSTQPVCCPSCGQSLSASVVDGTSEPDPVDFTETTEAWAGADTSKHTILSASDIQRDFGFLAPSEAADEIGRLGTYRVLKILSIGGMGAVFQAEDPLLNRSVAIKVMLPASSAKPGFRERFLREARTAASIDHEHIVTIYAVGEQQGNPYLVMQLLQGESLLAYMKRVEDPPIADVVRIGREIASGLSAAHERGLIHRDIKPANIWLEGKRARVKILDFGLAREALPGVHLTHSGVVLGTPAYMAPEQARGEKIDHRCDLFSLGCVLYRLITGQTPFTGKDMLSIMMALATDEPPPMQNYNPAVPTGLVELVEQLLAKNPDYRPANAQRVVEFLSDIEAGLSLTLGNSAATANDLPELSDDELLPEEESSDGYPEEYAPPASKIRTPILLPRKRLAELSGEIMGRFAIGRVLGRGHHGVVFQARDQRNQQKVALKVLAAEFPHNDAEIERFSQGMKIGLPLQHPNLVGMRAAGKTGSYCWIAMEFVEGESLADRIKQRNSGKFDWPDALRLGIQIGRGLELAKRHRLIHSNITPRNILLRREDDVAQLNDLVLAKSLRRSRLQQLVLDEKLEAEASYLAPEQVDSEATFVDQLCDLYSLGVVLYQMVTGQPPYRGDSMEETLDQIRQGHQTRPKKLNKAIPASLDFTICKMMDRNQVNRFQSPTELLAELEHIAKEHGEAV